MNPILDIFFNIDAKKHSRQCKCYILWLCTHFGTHKFWSGAALQLCQWVSGVKSIDAINMQEMSDALDATVSGGAYSLKIAEISAFFTLMPLIWVCDYLWHNNKVKMANLK